MGNSQSEEPKIAGEFIMGNSRSEGPKIVEGVDGNFTINGIGYRGGISRGHSIIIYYRIVVVRRITVENSL